MDKRGSIAVFKWTGELPTDEEVGADPATRYSDDFGEQWAYQATQPLAISILEGVRARGHPTDVDNPYFGEHGWHFCAEVDQKNYAVMVLWTVRGNDNDCFAVQPSLRRGCIAGLCLPSPKPSALQPVCQVLNEVLARHPQVADLEWVDAL